MVEEIEIAIRGRWPLTLRTDWPVVRRTTLMSPTGTSSASLVSETSTVNGLVLVHPAEDDLLPGDHDEGCDLLSHGPAQAVSGTD